MPHLSVTRRHSRDPAAHLFRASDSERAAFEVGIKLGAVYHQFLGAPIDPRGVAATARAIEASVRVQPFVESARVRIRLPRAKRTSPYRYQALAAEHLDVWLRVRYGTARAEGRLRFDPTLEYPLMSVRVTVPAVTGPTGRRRGVLPR